MNRTRCAEVVLRVKLPFHLRGAAEPRKITPMPWDNDCPDLIGELAVLLQSVADHFTSSIAYNKVSSILVNPAKLRRWAYY